MFLHWLIFALTFGYPQQGSPDPEQRAAARREASLRYERSRQESIRVNDLAAHISSEADARAYVDAVADMFADVLPPSWATRGIRERLATLNMRRFPIRCGRFPSNGLPMCGTSTFGKSALRKRRS